MAVLTAIGSEAFLRDDWLADVLRPRYAQTLCKVLQNAADTLGCGRHDRCPLDVVVLCFTKGDERNAAAYQEHFKKYDNSDISVHLLTNHDPWSVSHELAMRLGTDVVGMLNPSSAHATRLGRIGTYFDGGQLIGPEEITAVATTVLTMNRSVNLDLWTDPKRQHAVRL